MDTQENNFKVVKVNAARFIYKGEEGYARVPYDIHGQDETVAQTIVDVLNTDLTFPMEVRSFGLNVSIKVLLGVYVPVLVANSNEKAKELAELLTIK